MEESKIKDLWKAANEKLEESLVLSRQNAVDITGIKIQHFLNSMKPAKIFTLFAGIIWVGFGTIILSRIYLYAFPESNKFFLFSASLQVALTAIALWVYIYQLITIYDVEITDPILKTQKRLASLKTSTLWTARFLFLQLPLWTIFWWNETMFREWNIYQWLITGSVTLAFTIVAIWLFLNIKYENRNRKWFKLIFTGKEWTPLMKSMELLEQIDEYKSERQ